MVSGSVAQLRVNEQRARESAGISSDVLYRMAARLIAARHVGGGRVVDVGCGKGRLWRVVQPLFGEYHGVDLIEYPEFPGEGRFHRADLNVSPLPLPDDFAEAVVAVGTIEYLENPWSFVRELARVAREGGVVLFSTPNQLSLLSKLTLMTKNRFNAFQALSEEAPLTSLLPSDLVRMARSARLDEVAVCYTDQGRMPFTSRHWPLGLKGRAFSDAVVCVGRKPHRR